MTMTITNNNKIPIGAGIIVFDTEDPDIIRLIENFTHAVNAIAGSTTTNNYILLHDITKNDLVDVMFNNRYHVPKIIYDTFGIESYRVIFYERAYHLYYAHRSHNAPPAGASGHPWVNTSDIQKTEMLKRIIAEKGVPRNG